MGVGGRRWEVGRRSWEAGVGCIFYSFGTPFKLSSKSNILRPLWTILDSLAPWGHFGEIFEEVGGVVYRTPCFWAVVVLRCIIVSIFTFLRFSPLSVSPPF